MGFDIHLQEGVAARRLHPVQPTERTLIRGVLLVLLVAAAGCSTAPSGTGQSGASPHYKVGQPYQINGRWYHPREDDGYDAVGVASWYGDAFHGKRTANGEIFDKTRLSAAHTTLPMPSIVEVENLENGRRVTLRVNDRGPFAGDRIIDLSQSAAQALGFEKQGLAKVRVRYLGRANLADLAPRYGERLRVAEAAPKRAPPTAAAKPAPRPATPVAMAKAEPLNMAPVASTGDALAMAPVASVGDYSVEGGRDVMAGMINEALSGPPETAFAAEYWIDVAAYESLDALEADRSTLAALGAPDLRVVSTAAGGTARYGLQVGPFANPDAAEARLAALREAGYPRATIGLAACEAEPVVRTC